MWILGIWFTKRTNQKLETGMGRERRGEARVFREVNRAESTVKWNYHCKHQKKLKQTTKFQIIRKHTYHPHHHTHTSEDNRSYNKKDYKKQTKLEGMTSSMTTELISNLFALTVNVKYLNIYSNTTFLCWVRKQKPATWIQETYLRPCNSERLNVKGYTMVCKQMHIKRK